MVDACESAGLVQEAVEALRALCANDAEFARMFVLPDFSDRWLRTQYPWHPDIHSEAGRRAQAILAMVLGGEKDWPALAGRMGAPCRKLRVSSEGGIRGPADLISQLLDVI